MAEIDSFNIEVNTNKQLLSSETKIFKTEKFFYQTKKLSGIDKFVLKIAESMISLVPTLIDKYLLDESVTAFKVETFDKSFSFIVRLGYINTVQVQSTNIYTLLKPHKH